MRYHSTPLITFGGLVLAATALVGCSAGSTGSATRSTADGTASVGSVAAAAGAVLPVTSNPIVNTSTDPLLAIDSVLVENNVDASTGADADDHLEIVLSNSGPTPLADIEIYYTVSDATTGTSESYYAKLPADFTVPVGGSRAAHFDNTGVADHFPVNDFGLLKTSLNELDVTVTVSATGAAPQTAAVIKDAGGSETAD